MSKLTSKHGLLSLALSSILILSACSKEAQQPQERPLMGVATITLEASNMSISSTLPGRIEAIKEAEIRARVSGIVQSINFEQGSTVKAGQLLFKIDPATYQANYNAAQAAVAQAQANANSANSLANRYAPLVKANAISQQEYISAVAAAKQSNAAVESAKATLESAKINLSYTDVTSPIDGIAGRALVTEGALVSASTATPLAIVQQMDQVYVDFTQSTSDVSALRKAFAAGELIQSDAQSALIHLILDDGSTYDKPGKLLFSGVSVDPSTGMVNLRAVFPNPDQILLPGMFVRAKIVRGVQPNAIAIPNQALQRQSDGSSMVYIIREGKVAAIPVLLGSAEGQKTIITSGLTAGDQLIVEGFSKIGPGMPVKPMPWSKFPNVPKPEAKPAQ